MKNSLSAIPNQITFLVSRFLLALARIRRLVAHIKAVGKDGLMRKRTSKTERFWRPLMLGTTSPEGESTAMPMLWLERG